jgi:predicted phage terminase large subunit-like protein
MFIMDIFRKKVDTDTQIEKLLEWHLKYNFRKVAVETNASQYVIAENLRKKSRERGIYIPIKEVNQSQDKKLRFQGIVPFLKDGTILIDNHKYMTDNQYKQGIDEVCTFTGLNDAHDDVPDALEMAFNVAKKPRFQMLTKQNR